MNFETKEISSRERLASQMPVFKRLDPLDSKGLLNFKHENASNLKVNCQQIHHTSMLNWH